MRGSVRSGAGGRRKGRSHVRGWWGCGGRGPQWRVHAGHARPLTGAEHRKTLQRGQGAAHNVACTRRQGDTPSSRIPRAPLADMAVRGLGAVRSLMPGQDLTSVTIPAFFLEPRSLLERMADTLMHPDLLLAAVACEDPVDRMKGMVKWFLSGFHYKTVVRAHERARARAPACLLGVASTHVRAHTLALHRAARVQGVKKPFNPIVGETFACVWEHDDGSRSEYFAEQVGHRPPISAIYFENRQHKICASAHVWTKSQFNAPQTVRSILEGACILKLLEREEVRCQPARLGTCTRRTRVYLRHRCACVCTCVCVCVCVCAGVLPYVPHVLRAWFAGGYAAHGDWRLVAHCVQEDGPARGH
ncbi:hypothetical protein EON67_02575 [archaeon]|nr:MAG: hypothetical protein EON67_02575 [archaeon]